MVDSADTARTTEALEELENMLKEPDLKDVPLLVFANKQDLALALTAQEIAEALKLDAIKDRKWSIFACCALTKEGIQEGMEWLVKNLQKGK